MKNKKGLLLRYHTYIIINKVIQKRVWTKAVENIGNYSYNHNCEHFFIIWRRGNLYI